MFTTFDFLPLKMWQIIPAVLYECFRIYIETLSFNTFLNQRKMTRIQAKIIKINSKKKRAWNVEIKLEFLLSVRPKLNPAKEILIIIFVTSSCVKMESLSHKYFHSLSTVCWWNYIVSKLLSACLHTAEKKCSPLWTVFFKCFLEFSKECNWSALQYYNINEIY